MKRRNISRRKFVGQAACAAVGSMPFLSTLLNLSMMNSLTASTAKLDNDYKALVCIQLLGGNDAFNTLIPNDTDAYAHYSNFRSTLALPQEELLALNGVNFGLHPNLSGLRDLYNDQQNIAFLCNVGPLVEPMNASQYENSEKEKPLGLYSHIDQRHHWHTSVPSDRNAVGWGGRLAEIMTNLNTTQNVSMNISLGGRNVFQAGENMIDYSISGSEIGTIRDIFNTNMGFLNLLRDTATNDLMTASYTNIFKQTFAGQMKNAIVASEILGAAVADVPEFATTFSETSLSEDLRMVAKVIAGQAAIGMNRQTFFVTIGGWDIHHPSLSEHAELLTILNDALVEFNSALGEINRQNDVTTFTISDFGRTVTTNGSGGSDHAWGGHQIVMGGAVNGGIHGTYPDLNLNANPLNTSHRGSFIPSISTDEFFAELALWFGVSYGELEDVLPNIGTFYTPSNTPPLGFMNY